MVIQPKFWLEEVFATPTQTRLLRLLANDPVKYWTGREAGQAAGMPQSTVNLALQRLRKLGILDLRQVGPSLLFRLRDDITFNGHLLAIFEEEDKTYEEILDWIRAAVPKEASCYLFGSAADNDAAPHDIDLLIVASTREEAERVAQNVRMVVRERSPVALDVFTLSKRDLKRKEHASLIKKILENGKHVAGKPIAEVGK